MLVGFMLTQVSKSRTGAPGRPMFLQFRALANYAIEEI